MFASGLVGGEVTYLARIELGFCRGPEHVADHAHPAFRPLSHAAEVVMGKLRPSRRSHAVTRRVLPLRPPRRPHAIFVFSSVTGSFPKGVDR